MHRHDSNSDPTTPHRSALAEVLVRRTGLLVLAAVAVTAALALPFLTMAPMETASNEPSGDVFTARDRIDETFVSSVHPTFLILEPESGEVLTAESLNGLAEASRALRSDPEIGPNLVGYLDPDTELDVEGVMSLADLVDVELRERGVRGLEAATDTEVRRAGSAVIDELGERSELLGLSARSSRSDSGWSVPAVTVLVLSDNEALGFGNVSVNLGGDTAVEEYDRSIQEAFRVEGWQANGVAIDVNLTSEEQGAVAGPFIGFTVLAVLLMVGLTFGSYWVLATVSVAFLSLIIWLKGISNLIGLKDDLVLSLIVPVAMISFGVDFAFHAIGRYREERAEGRHAGLAIVTGLSAVSGALILALVSDTSAFLANLTSGIESINQFGIGAAIALVSAYLLLGILTPLVVARVEAEVPAPTPGFRSTMLRLIAAFATAGLTMASVLLMVYVAPTAGVVLGAFTLAATLVVPFLVARRRSGQRVGEVLLSGGTSADEIVAAGAPAGRIGSGVRALARRRLVVLPVALAVTIVAGVFALRVPVEFDVEDFFAADTDFVVGLNQLDAHVGDRGGEPAIIYLEGDLTDPERLGAVAGRIEELRDLEVDSLGRDGSGRVDVQTGLFDVFDRALDSDLMLGLVEERTGVAVTDSNGDGIPDSRTQVAALLGVAGETGIPLDSERVLVTPDQVNTVIDLGAGDEPDRAVLQMAVVDSRAQESVTATRTALEPVVEGLSGDLGGGFVQVTGSAFVREASLDGTNRALQQSLPLSVLLCLLVATVFLRSVRYGLAAIVPILMVVSWLYAFMYVAGYAINLVTATIAAVSIGIGIDFAIHFIARYREELEVGGQRLEAATAAGEGTGTALVASAVSSAIGFGILALAPMPLFAAYGLLTALMIAMALAATLVVLPGLLVVLTTDRPKTEPAGGDGGLDGPDRTRRAPAELVGELS